MQTSSKTLIDLEKRFWQSLVDQDTDTAVALLSEPALMVSSHGAMKFDHAGYRKMAEQGSMVLTSYELSDVEVVFPNDTTAILTYGVKQDICGNRASSRVAPSRAFRGVQCPRGDGFMGHLDSDLFGVSLPSRKALARSTSIGRISYSSPHARQGLRAAMAAASSRLAATMNQ